MSSGLLQAPGDPGRSPLLTDLYQLTMLQAYWQHGMHGTAVFELFVRALPPGRRFLVAAGLDAVLAFAQQARFSDAELAWIDGCGRFAPGFADWLRTLRFEGEIHALPEGTVFFADEPLLQVVAPIAQAQLLETRILNLVHYQTLVASKAARCVLAAQGRALVDFGLRRAHGAEAGVLAARAAWIAGFAGTATALAAPRDGIPVFGTMAHSFVQAHDDEADAFTHFAESFPDNAVLLLDTYDTVAAARTVAALAPRLAARGIRIKGVRLDSGDLDALSRAVRAVLDDAGLREVDIFASGNLDEYRVRDLVRAGAPIASFGIGTALTTSADAPYLDAVYKLQEYDGRARRKRSAGKATWPGRKQVWRRLGADGRFAGDVVGLADESHDGTPLLVPALRGGERVLRESLQDARRRCAAQLAQLPPALAEVDPSPPAVPYPVTISAPVRALAQALDAGAPAVPPLLPPARFGSFDHDADVGVIGRGARVEDALAAAAAALFDLRCPLAAVQPRRRIDVEFDESDPELALVAWLNALLAQAHVEGLALGRFALARDGARWRGSAWGEPWHATLPRGIDVKGATLTALAVRPVEGGWEARCVVDV